MNKSIAEQLIALGIAPPRTLAELLRRFPVFEPLRALKMHPETRVSFWEQPVIETWTDPSGSPVRGDRWLLKADFRNRRFRLIDIRPEHENLPPAGVEEDFGPVTHLAVVTQYDRQSYSVSAWIVK